MANTNTMQLAPSSSTMHSLIGKWNLYYHLPHDKKWDLSSYQVILGNIDTAESVIAINQTIPEHIVKYCMVLLCLLKPSKAW